MSGILDGLRVIEGGAFVAAPSAGMNLALIIDTVPFRVVGVEGSDGTIELGPSGSTGKKRRRRRRTRPTSCLGVHLSRAYTIAAVVLLATVLRA